jgi:hypothetical protein
MTLAPAIRGGYIATASFDFPPTARHVPRHGLALLLVRQEYTATLAACKGVGHFDSKLTGAWWCKPMLGGKIRGREKWCNQPSRSALKLNRRSLLLGSCLGDFA